MIRPGHVIGRGPSWRNLRLLRQSALYELQKASAFRTGFLVREILRGSARPAVMVFVYLAIFRLEGIEEIRGFRFLDLARYLILVATLEKIIFHERGLDVSEQIFEGYITKYLVMPVRYFVLALGRWVQFVTVQCGIAALMWGVGAVLFPGFWPIPSGVTPVLQALTLTLLGSYCYFLLFYILNCLAFWLDVVWSLLVMARFVTLFISGVLIPVSIMPDSLQSAFAWLFPYWTLSAPIEIFLGRLGTPEFLRGLVVLLVSILVLDRLRAFTWARGVRRYSGSGM